MATPKWKTDGIAGFDKVIRRGGKLYKLATVKTSSSFAGMARAKKQARQYAGKDGKVFKINNTYDYAVYLPYSGAERPPRRK